MRLRERPVEQMPRGQNPAGDIGNNLDQLRQAGESFFAAGDDAINRALSGNSEAFLMASRQEVGE